MNKPMTTAQVNERYKCDCKPDDNCNCLLSSTCSYNCPHCDQRIWFPGFVSNHGNPKIADCPYCHKKTKNPHHEVKCYE